MTATGPSRPKSDCSAGTSSVPAHRVFDLGAHQGVVALMLSRVVGPEGLVVAVEANSSQPRVAERNRASERRDLAEDRPRRSGRGTGTLVFNESLNGQVDDGTGSWGRVEVRALHG